MSAVLGGHLEIVTMLLEIGADVTIPEKDGYTPMHGAGFQVHFEFEKKHILTKMTLKNHNLKNMV